MFSSLPNPCRISARLLILSALLIPVMAGCDTSNPIEPTVDNDGPGLSASAKQLDAAIQIPDPPKLLELTGAYVPPETVRRLHSPRHAIEPVGRWLERLKKTTSWDDAIVIAANAAMSIVGMPPGAQRPLGQRLTRTLRGVAHLSDLVARPDTPTREDIVNLVGADYAGVATICFVGFSDHDALNGVPDVAANTFAYSPFYRQNCDVANVQVEPTVYNHVHLNFEDTSIDCVDTTVEGWPFGREVDGECVAVDDFADEDRILATHTGAGIVRITAEELFIGTPRTFDLISFANVSDIPIKLRYRTESGDWYQFDSLGGPANWGISAYDVVEVLLTHEGTSLDCGIEEEAGAPGGCQTAFERFFADDFVVGL
jgi:hypothetical protein